MLRTESLTYNLVTEKAHADDAEFLSKKTHELDPHLLPVSPDVYSQGISKGLVYVVRDQTQGQIRASLRLIQREKPVIEIGSVWSEVRGAIQTMFQDIILSNTDSQKVVFAFVTSQDNKKMLQLGEQFGFTPTTSNLPGLAACLKKDIASGSNPHRVLMARMGNLYF